MKSTTLLIASFFLVTLHAQDKPIDPYKAKEAAIRVLQLDKAATLAEREAIRAQLLKMETAAVAQASKGKPEASIDNRTISICYEAFSLPLAMAAELQRQQLSDPELYTKLISEIGKESVKQEDFQLLRGRNGGKARSENVSEQIYVIEYDIPVIEQKKEADPVRVSSGASPAAWETRNVGSTLEVETHLSDDSSTVNLRILPELVTLTGYSNWETPSSIGVKMPEFEKQRLDTSAIVTLYKPFLLGTFSRPPNSKIDSDSANRVWFAFVTATLAKN
jgi:hypothetical protein